MGARARTSSRPAPRCTGCRPAQRFAIDGDRNPAAANGSSAQGGAGLPDLLRLVALDDPRRRLAAGHVAGCSRACRCRPGCGSTTAGSTARRCCRRAVAVDRRPRRPHPAARRRGPLHAEPRLREAGAERLRARLTSDAAGALRSEQAVQASAGLERALGRRVRAAARGLLQALHRRADRPARTRGRTRWPASRATTSRRSSPGSIPTDPLITTVPTNDGRGRAYGFDLFVSRPAAGRRPAARLGQLHLGPGRARRLRPPLPVRVRPPARVHGGGGAAAHAAAGSSRRRRAWPRASRAPRRSGVRVAGVEDDGRSRRRRRDRRVPARPRRAPAGWSTRWTSAASPT